MRRLAFLFLLLPAFSAGPHGSVSPYNRAISELKKGNYPEAIFYWRLSWVRGEERAEAQINSLKRRLGIREGAPLRKAHPDLPAALLLLSLIGLFAYSLMVFAKRKKPSWKLLLPMVLVALVLLFWTLRERQYYAHPPLCVVREKGKIYSAPSPNFPIDDVLAGEELRCRGQGRWLQVETPWGTSGWIPADRVVGLK